MSAKLPHTPSSHVRNALRQLTLRGREKNLELKAANRACRVCGRKHSTAKGREVRVEAHHVRRPDWERVIRVVREELLDGPWRALCTECHGKAPEHEGEGR